MKVNKDNIIYVDFALTKKKVKSKRFMGLYKFFSFFSNLIPLPKKSKNSKRYAKNSSKITSNY